MVWPKDGVHPSQRGHDHLAQKLTGALGDLGIPAGERIALKTRNPELFPSPTASATDLARASR
jgi:hypothetical protein